MSRAPRIVTAWLPALFYMALIWVASSFSNPPSVENVPFRDKGVHAFEYALLAALLMHALRGTALRARSFTLFASAVACAALWGLLDEIHQAYVPNRNADPHDLLADSIGALIGATLYFLVVKALSKRNSQSRSR